ncbi:hypothetical protein Avbf_08403 [Armadillidium vulgare]|nr:hypothetical protein Avbf_08403 [Armadillidium vulgare]
MLNRMPSSLKYLNIFQLKHVLRNSLNSNSSYGFYSSKSKFGNVKYKLDLSRNFSSEINRENFMPFEKLIEKRRTEARRSVVVEIRSDDCINSLESLCSKFGNIRSIAEFKTNDSGGV